MFEYQNPTSRCASCGSNQGCCDAFSNTNCSGDVRCDNFFRFCIRPFQSEPNNVFETETDCPLRRLTSPNPFVVLNDNHLIFTTGVMALNGAPNPLPFEIAGSWNVSTSDDTITIPLLFKTCCTFALQGTAQIFIEVGDDDASTIDDIVDRFYIDRGDIELGSNFSAAQFYIGSFGWGNISLALRVNCAEGFSGEDCNIQFSKTDGITSSR